MLDNISYWDEFLNQEEYLMVWDECEKYKWSFESREDSKHNPMIRTFWRKELIDSNYLKILFKSKVENYLNKKIETDRLYANGQSHGQSAWLHRDTPIDTEGKWGSLVYYLHPDWNPLFGGHIVFTDDDHKRVINTFFPKTNSAILFNSKLAHAALEPTVYCTSMRLSIAFKFKIIES